LTKNKYKIIKKDGIPVYIMVQLSQDYVMLTDYDKLDIIKKYNLCVSYGQLQAGQTVRARYVGITVNNKTHLFHKFITGFDMTDHINGYPLDDRMINLQETNSKKNNNNRTCVNNVVFNDTVELRKKMVKCIITYTERGTLNKKTIDACFLNKKDAEKWSRDIVSVLDENSVDVNREELANDFIKIMEQHAGTFKWHDKSIDLTTTKPLKKRINLKINGDFIKEVDAEKIADEVEESDEVDEVDEEEVDEVDEEEVDEVEVEETENDKPQLDAVEDKISIYKKYNLINPLYDIKQIDMSGRATKHIIDGQNEYKYCSACKVWSLINNYFSNSANYDKLDRNCKSCKKNRSSASTKAWKQMNKEKISEYNKTYREQKKQEANEI